MRFREMGKPDKALPADMLKDIVGKADYSVVSMTGDDGYPYGLPVNLAYIDGALYFHGAARGKKLDSLRKNPKVCVTTAVDVAPDPQRHNCYYTSAICFGTARVLAGEENLEAGARYGEYYGLDAQVVQHLLARTGVKEVALVKIDIEHVSIRDNKPVK